MPYFAHKSGRADPKCELYHSVPDYAQVTRISEPRERGAHAHGPSPRDPELFLEVSPALQAKLLLLVPKAENLPKWSGAVRLETFRGERQFTQEQLNVDEYVEVEPRSQDYSMELWGQVADEYRSIISQRVRGLDSGISIFRAAQSRSRRLGPSDVLRWGESLWLLVGTEETYGKVCSLFLDRSLAIRDIHIRGDWRSIEVDLPDETELSIEAKTAFSELFQREIRNALPDLLLLQPLPHHFTEGGEWVVPAGTTRILLFRSSPVPISVVAVQGNDSIQVEDVSDDVVEVSNVTDGAIRVWAGHSRVIEVRVESCDFRAAQVVSINISGDNYSLTRLRNNSDLRAKARREASNVDLMLTHDAIRSITTLKGLPWPGNEIFRTYLADSTVPLRLEIDNVVSIDFEALEITREVAQGRTITERTQLNAMPISNLAQVVGGPAVPLTVNRKSSGHRLLLRSQIKIPLAVVPHLRRLIRR